jgi:hypothetical protein
MQWFENGRVRVVRPPAEGSTPIQIGDAQVLLSRGRASFESSGPVAFVVGLSARHAYREEADDEEMQETETDPAGTLDLQLPRDRRLRVLIHEEK